MYWAFAPSIAERAAAASSCIRLVWSAALSALPP